MHGRSSLVKVCSVIIAYVLLCEFSLFLQHATQLATQVWPAAGLALACVLMLGPGVWPAFFIGTLLVHVLHGDSVVGFIGPAVGNSLEPVVGAYICNLGRDFRPNLDRLQDIVRVLVGGAIVSPAIAALVAVSWLHMADHPGINFRYFVQYWIGDSMGVIMLAPLMLTFINPNPLERLSLSAIPIWERGLFGLALCLAATGFSNTDLSLRIYFFVPLLLWSALRLGQRGATFTSFIVSSVAIWYAALGTGPMSLTSDSVKGQFYLYTFVATIAMTGMIVAAVICQREFERNAIQKSEDELQKSHETLAQTVSALEKAKAEADAASAAKSAFLANMSHEIRTPLGIVLGFSELIIDGSVTPEERQRYANTIKKNGRQLANIIDDILDLSKVEADKMGFSINLVLFSEIVTEITDLLAAARLSKSISTSVRVVGDMPLSIQTDPLRLRQILTNIIGNASKFTAHGSVQVKIYLTAGRQLAFDVIDTGRGISPDQAKKLFSPFTQVDFSATRQYGGTGLGLALARRLARKLGGDVVLSRSALARGSTFTITIDPGPITLLAKARMSGLAENAAPLPPSSVKPLHDLRVLLVDDSSENLILVSHILKLEGAQIETAANGQTAIAMAKETKYDVVLMDLQMPGMDGYQATDTLRHDGYQGPIIALTAHAMKEDRDRCLSSGFNDHLSKPIERRVLAETLSRYVC
jgi:signal transduction histidine kinase/CheY-like chemotaxis protein